MAGIPIWSWRELVRGIFVWFQILVWRLSAFHCWILYWLWVLCWAVINSFYVELCSLYIHLCKGFFKNHEWMLNFIKCFFCVCWDHRIVSALSLVDVMYVSHWLVCIWWTIFVTLRWIQLGHGVWPFLCVVRFSLLIFYWEFLHLYLSKILTCNFLFLVVCLCLVLVLGWQWLH